MKSQTRNSISGRAVIMTAASALLGLGVIAAPAIAQPGMEQPLILAETAGMERREERRDDRGERRDDRQEGRSERRDTRQDCREEGGLVGKDKRDCKQEGRSDSPSGEGDEG